MSNLLEEIDSGKYTGWWADSELEQRFRKSCETHAYNGSTKFPKEILDMLWRFASRGFTPSAQEVALKYLEITTFVNHGYLLGLKRGKEICLNK